MSTHYVNFQKGSVEYDEVLGVFSCGWGGAAFLKGGRLALFVVDARRAFSTGDFKAATSKCEPADRGWRMTLSLSGGPTVLPGIDLRFTVRSDSIALDIQAPCECAMSLEGDLHWGADPERSTFAVRLDRTRGDLRAASGPAASNIDNALFDRLSDAVVEIAQPAGARPSYDWARACYRFRAKSAPRTQTWLMALRVHENYFARKFSVPYRPVRGETQFKTPPVGWMTWYAVKFNASEKTVLDNARWMAKHLAAYGANCIWVDWEWYHGKIDPKVPEQPDVNTFSPDARRYPNGLQQVSGEIRSLGLIPAIWIGPTNDPNRNRFMIEHPECVLAEQPAWCGRWWLDPSHPKVAKTFIPEVFRQLLDWGYEAFKWDCIPMSLMLADKHHARFHNPEVTPYAALRSLFLAAREVIGPARYMMSCAGFAFRDITVGMDVFDGGRVGGDVFTWDEYVREAVYRAFAYLCFNNILFYADLDNVVIRDEFNTVDQARSRVSFSGLTGTPVTLGDHLPGLQPERVELLRRIIPVLDIHPMDLDAHKRDADVVILNLLVAKPFEQWNVVDIFNTTGEARRVRLDLAADLHLAAGQGEAYLVYDYWQGTFLGKQERALEFELAPHASKVLGIRLLQDRPQVLSTSRHISQGGHDLIDVRWDPALSLLRGASKVVGGERYVLTLHAPDGYRAAGAESSVPRDMSPCRENIIVLALLPERSGDASWSVAFHKEGKNIEN